MILKLLEKITLVASRGFKLKDTTYFPEKNPEVRKKPKRFRGRHYIDAEKCIGCSACARACPIDAIVMVPTGYKRPRALPVVNLARCCYCGLCEDACPTKEKSIYLTDDYDIIVEELKLSKEINLKSFEAYKGELWAIPQGDLMKNPLVKKELSKNKKGG